MIHLTNSLHLNKFLPPYNDLILSYTVSADEINASPQHATPTMLHRGLLVLRVIGDVPPNKALCAKAKSFSFDFIRPNNIFLHVYWLFLI